MNRLPGNYGRTVGKVNTIPKVRILTVSMVVGLWPLLGVPHQQGLADSPPKDTDAHTQQPRVLGPAHLQAARTQVGDVFESETAQAKTPAQKVSLAKTMIQIASEASEPAEAYVLLEKAVALAIDGHDPFTLDEGIAALKKRFGVDLVGQRQESLIRMAKKAPLESLGVVIDKLVAEAESAAAAGLIKDATDTAKAAAGGARRLRDSVRQKATTELLQQLKELEKVQATIQPLIDRLAANPRDAEALLEVGKHRCYAEGNWQAGLKLLAQCSDPAIAQAAKADLASDASAAGHAKVADLWFAINAAESGRGPSGPSERARYHYELAASKATGLDRARIMKRLEEIAKLEGGADNWMVIFRSNDPSIWNTKTEEGFLRFALPLDSVPPTVRYARIRRPNGESVVLPITKQQLGEDVPNSRYGWRGAGKTLLKDPFLGIRDAQKPIAQPDYGKVTLGSGFSGWGFGHKIKSGNQTSMAWNGETIPREPLEISVLTRELTPKERRQAQILD